MKRYTNTNTKIDRAGNRVYTTTLYPPIPIENSDQFISAKQGTRIDNLAFQYYGDNSLWWIIAKANGIKGRVIINTGELIRIPTNTNKIIRKFKQLNGE